MKIVVDRTRCTGLGMCEAVAPEVFEVNVDGELVLLADTVPDVCLAEVHQAIEGCPTEALRLQD